ncbi:ISL3 family transposase [Haploplasma axanthum]|uniref:Transposase and inactivated derivatives n=1 Tax=Haploplasma axanthum TaxID=29552 RepID=A0A449BF05_HAPAX|nr:ISL3 family transposase [Haploplasma axanthum]VEU81016.1 Transposase and inactivated derivatives [Haploplasma axanthum]
MFNHIIKLYELESIEDKILHIDSITSCNELIIEITLKRTDEICPFCSSKFYTIKDYVKKKIIHSISVTRNTFISYKQKRYVCKNCSKSFYEKNPFISTNKQISTLTVMNILDYLKDFNHTFSSAACLYNVSTQSVINIFDYHINPKPRYLPRVLSIDEVHIKSNTKHPYACVLLDFETNKIIDVLESRKKDYLSSYFERKSIKELDNVEFITIDLWSTYRNIAKKFMPKAKIVADSFHIVSLINKILDKKRISVMNSYLKNPNTNLNYSNDFGYLLKKFSWLIRLNPGKLNNKLLYVYKYKINVYSKTLLDHLLSSNTELNDIYSLRNIYTDFNRTSNYDDAHENLNEMINIFSNHNNYEIRQYGKTLKRWKNEILNSFIREGKSRYSNGKLEGKNRDIKTILRNSYGYTNFNRFRSRVLYSINKDVELTISKK